MVRFSRMTTTGKSAFRDNVMRVIAIIGLIAVLLLGAWGIIQLAFYIPTLFNGSRSATSAVESLTVSANSPVTSGETLNVSWRGKDASGARAYTVSYSCVDGLSIKAPTPSGTSQSVPCNTPFNFTGAEFAMTITPTITGTKQVQVALTVTAVDLSNNKTTATASANTTVLPKASAAATTKPKTTASNYTASGRTQNLFGYADLSVRILSVTPSGNRTSVVFEVQNLGTNAAPAGWSFNALIPSASYSTTQSYTYPSGAQQALYPGDKIVYTIGFDSLGYAGGNYNYTYPYSYNYSYGLQYTQPSYAGYNCYTYNGTVNYPAPCTGVSPYARYPYSQTSYSYNTTARIFTVQADPYNQIVESSEANNTATAQVW